MNKAQIDGFKKLAGSLSQSGEYAITDKHGYLVMGWLTKERATSYLACYPKGEVITMDEWKQRVCSWAQSNQAGK